MKTVIYYSPKYKSTHDHHPECVHQCAGRKNQLSNQENEHVYDGSQANAKHTIYQETTNEAEDDIGPGINRVEHCELGRRKAQIFFEVVLQGRGIVIAKI